MICKSALLAAALALTTPSAGLTGRTKHKCSRLPGHMARRGGRDPGTGPALLCSAKATSPDRSRCGEGPTQRRSRRPRFPEYDYSMDWETAGQSLAPAVASGVLRRFTGGAHPEHGNEALLWDRRLCRQVIGFAFLRPPSFAAMDRAPYCHALDAEREVRREGRCSTAISLHAPSSGNLRSLRSTVTGTAGLKKLLSCLAICRWSICRRRL